MIEVVFTHHSRERMLERRINEWTVRSILNSFDTSTPYRDGFRLFKKVDGRNLAIGVTKDNGKIVITTVIDKDVK